ncbi:LytTR family DNA-binding domain-containing protein [Vibrio tapetis subsp. quintayensis]|uniref:LytR/AlgR family response regulator transcription factor n=1 Tax=Vibrio tapetis TaxID=52443 RepID=UPI0025B2DB58|nr:LytTR family DNA-binding domain-containing protein [Vibrio tapetis]MDN3681283.1 LytTR family DNA-binding domain-containing protein [Vibrio tapetis subsp. quintayensis]
MPSNMITAVIADDEPLLLHHLNKLLGEAWPQLNVLTKASDGKIAFDAILEQEPDVVFLDIRMPNLDGITLAKKISKLNKVPYIVFTTAYDEYAVQAFEHSAVDYLLKPLSEDRLYQACLKLQQRIEAGLPRHIPDVSALVEQLQQANKEAPKEVLNWIRATKGEEIHLVPCDEVCYFKAEDKYISLFTRQGTQFNEYLIRTSLKDLLSQLDDELFWQIHRSTIVNVRKVEKVKKDFTGKMHVKIADRQLPVSRACQALFKGM